MKKYPKLILLLPLGALLAAAFWYYLHRGEAGQLVLSGNIEFRQVDVSFKSPGRLTDVRVEEGQRVRKGDVLARLDREQMERLRERDAAGVEQSSARLEQTETSIRLQEQVARGEAALREAELSSAEAKLSELESGSRPQEIQQAQAAAEDAANLFEQATRDWERAKQLFAARDISAQQHDLARTRYRSAQALVQQSSERLALVREGPRKTDVAMARAAVDRARAALQLARAQQLEVKRRREEAVAMRADVRRARSTVAAMDTQLNDAEATSPLDGVVLSRSADPGEVVAAGTPVLSLGEIDKAWFRGYVPQQMLGRISLGQSVQVRSDSWPGKIYRGRISFIASEAEFTPRQIQTQDERTRLVYRVKVEVENPNQELKLNMPVDATLQLATQP
jgi:HlyD family secretion protein